MRYESSGFFGGALECEKNSEGVGGPEAVNHVFGFGQWWTIEDAESSEPGGALWFSQDREEDEVRRFKRAASEYRRTGECQDSGV